MRLVLTCAAVMACASNPPATQPLVGQEHMTHPNTLSAAERAQGFRLLFDGKTTDGWRGYRQEKMPDGWQVVDGALTRVAATTDIVTEEQFANFELRLDWMVEPGGNSGIMFRVTEDNERSYHSGPEVQILDDAHHQDGASRLTAAGSNYALHPAPAGVAKPAGEWNEVRLVVDGAHVEHWLNGEKIVEYELWSDDWERRVRESKFAEWPVYGRAHSGHIVLQEHGDRVSFRNVRIRVLP